MTMLEVGWGNTAAVPGHGPNAGETDGPSQ